MDTVIENLQNDPGMEANAEEIDKSFEIITKADVETATTDEMNNETPAVESVKLTEVDATNNNTIVGAKPATGRSISEQITTSDMKYSREELLQIKKSAGLYKPQISVDAIFKPDNQLLDQALNANLQFRAQRQNSNPKDPISCLMPSFDRPPQGRNYSKRDSYKGRNSQQGGGSKC
jgi:hypothetical protein